MDPRLDEYNERYDDYVELAEISDRLIREKIKGSSISPMQISYRIKTQDSVSGKLYRKPEKYPTLKHMTDIVGFRIICYFSDQVDIVAAQLEKLFEIDMDNSIDKRSSIPATAFGYLSLHYICHLKKAPGIRDELLEIPFEIQIRSVLQHTWAEIEHDLGYKSEFGVPRDIRREFSRVAGLLEIADELFINIKKDLADYKATVRQKIAEDSAGNMTIDLITLWEYISQSRTMRHLLQEISSITGAVINDADIEPFIQQLAFFGIETLDDLNDMVGSEEKGALLLAHDALDGVEIDEIASTSGLYYLIRSRLTFGDYDEKQISDFFRLIIKDEKRIRSQTARTLRKRDRLKDNI